MTEISTKPSEVSLDNPSEKPISTNPNWERDRNKNGRKPGSKNRITALKLGIEEQLRSQLNEYMPEVIQKAIELALKGDKLMIKTLLDLTISKPQVQEDTNHGREQVQVTIRKLELQTTPKFIDVKQTTTKELIDGEYEEKTSDGRVGESGSGDGCGSEVYDATQGQHSK